MDGDHSVALAALAIVASVSGALIWALKTTFERLIREIQEHTKSNHELAKAAKKQKQASDQVLKFMKLLNGKLAKATIQTVKEQKVEHQTVQVHD